MRPLQLGAAPFEIMDELNRILDMLERERDPRFTLEFGRGETYSHGKPTLYCHAPYPRSSVLYGQDKRVFVDQWESREEALKALTPVRETLGERFKFDDWTEDDAGGSSHVPVAQVAAHLPDEPDYDGFEYEEADYW